MIAPAALTRHSGLMNLAWTLGLTLGPSALTLLALWIIGLLS